ncbi:hypothetical protein TNCV_440301 [Trichonephila clavipes]|nr:hypothetical protein TNCV_440301 [Trichonephila clavipes]
MEHTKSLPLSSRGNHRLQISTLCSRAELTDSVCSRRESSSTEKIRSMASDSERALLLRMDGERGTEADMKRKPKKGEGRGRAVLPA